MSKPLIFVLQFVGLLLIIGGAPGALEGKSIGMFLVGLLLVGIGSIGWRRRVKKS